MSEPKELWELPRIGLVDLKAPADQESILIVPCDDHVAFVKRLIKAAFWPYRPDRCLYVRVPFSGDIERIDSHYLGLRTK